MNCGGCGYESVFNTDGGSVRAVRRGALVCVGQGRGDTQAREGVERSHGRVVRALRCRQQGLHCPFIY